MSSSQDTSAIYTASTITGTLYPVPRTLENHSWRHYAVTKKGAIMKYYVNGAYYTSTTNAAIDFDWSGYIIFNYVYQALDAHYADFRFYNEELTPKDISNIYASGNGTYASLLSNRKPYSVDTAGYTTFDEGVELNGEVEINGELVLIPQAAPTPVEGMVYYDATANKLKFYNGSAWETITSA